MAKNKYSATVIFGERAAKAYMNGGVQEMRNHIDEGQLVRKVFDTEAERKAYIAGIDDADGWYGSAVIDDEDLKKHPRIINQLLRE